VNSVQSIDAASGRIMPNSNWSKNAPSGAKQWAEEKRVALILVAVCIGVNPPTTTEISNVARAEFSREAGRADARNQLLKVSMRRQVGKDDGIIKQSLRLHVNDRACAATGRAIFREDIRSK
jgi:hypothetical protein